MKKTISQPKPVMEFTIEGGGDFVSSTTPSCVKAMVGVLEPLEDGKLLRVRALADRIGKSKSTLEAHIAHSALLDFKIVHRRIAYFGNKTTIAAARKQFSYEK